MATSVCQTSPAQSHKHSDSMDSEISFFETTSSCTTDSWNSYFDGWDKSHSQDLYCPQIVKSSSSAHQSNSYDRRTQNMEAEYIPTTLPQKRPRPDSTYIPASAVHHEQPKVKRFGLVSHGNQEIEDEAITSLNGILQNSSASTEALLNAMYNPNWDVASLQRWYQKSSRSSADLALYKIMFSLRYTPDEAMTGL